MLSTKFKNYNILLASQSPRRAELLKLMGLEFKTISVEVEENYPTDLHGKKITEFLANKKAEAYPILFDDEIVLTADTLVFTKEEVLGKPKKTGEAVEMLQKLSGNTHWVVSSFCIQSKSKKVIKSDQAKIVFQKLSQEEIDYYVNNFTVLDKAGAYGVQDWIGTIGIKKISGSYYTIMGLPTHLIYKELLKF